MPAPFFLAAFQIERNQIAAFEIANIHNSEIAFDQRRSSRAVVIPLTTKAGGGFQALWTQHHATGRTFPRLLEFLAVFAAAAGLAFIDDFGGDLLLQIVLPPLQFTGIFVETRKHAINAECK